MSNIAFSLETLAQFDDVRKQLFNLVQPGTPVESGKLLSVFTEFAEQLDKVFAMVEKAQKAAQVEETQETEEEDAFEIDSIDVDHALDYKQFVLQTAHALNIAEAKRVHGDQKAYKKASEYVEESFIEACETLELHTDEEQEAFANAVLTAFMRM